MADSYLAAPAAPVLGSAASPRAGGAVALALLAQIVLAGPARAQTEPSWPQRFQVLPGEAAGFGFAVNQAGPISVEVTTQGSAARVTLSGPITQPIQQIGSGTLRLSYNATAADVQKSSFWVVRVAEANPGPVSLGAPRAVISGTVTVRHPAANVQVVAAELQRSKAAAVQRAQSQPQMRLPDVLTAMKAAYARQIATQQATQKQQLLAAINRKPVALAGNPIVPKIAPTGTRTAPSVRTSGSGDPSGGAQSGATSGSTSTPPPAPQVTSLSIKQGQPRDAVLITGSGFGANQGQVHFIINPQMDKTASVDFWSDTQILTYVPDASGIGGFPAGQLYLQTAGGQRSALNPFQFNPTLDFAQIQPAWNEPDMRLDPTDLWNNQYTPFWHQGGSDFLWHSSDDIFYSNTVLKNGWVVDSALVIIQFKYGLFGGNSNAYAAESRVGTPSLYLRVHWWTDPMASVQYTPILRIKGPSGLPYR